MELAGKKILMVVAPKDFRDEEFLQPKEVFERVGAKVTIASKGVTEAMGMFGAKAAVDLDVSEVGASDYDAVVFVGGSGSSIYFDDETALGLVRQAVGRSRVVGAICIAPSILANAGVLPGKKATAFSSEAENLRAQGADYTGEAVCVDGKVITANGPEAATEFGEAIVAALKCRPEVTNLFATSE